jgi:glycosyltransferase involved in cell wall biosynthesis
MLGKHGNTLTSIETLGPLLEAEGHVLTYASDKKNKVWRLMDMIKTLITHRSTADVVLIDTYSTNNFWYAVSMAQLCHRFNIPYIPMLRGGDLPARLKTSFKHLKFLVDHSKVCVSPSNYLKTAFQEVGLSKVKSINNNIKIEDYTFKQRTSTQPNLLWVRSFSEIYNPTMAIKVFELVKKTYPHAQLCMIGPDKDGSLEVTKNAARDLGVEVEFPGKMSKEAWRELSESYDIFINTTYFDNVPISVLEAMALGLPVVSTNVGGLPFMLEDQKTALLVDDDSVQQMHDAIANLIEHPELSTTISNNARKETISYSWDVVKKHWIEILDLIPSRSEI